MKSYQKYVKNHKKLLQIRQKPEKTFKIYRKPPKSFKNR